MRIMSGYREMTGDDSTTIRFNKKFHTLQIDFSTHDLITKPKFLVKPKKDSKRNHLKTLPHVMRF
jgi:hypothetical protein